MSNGNDETPTLSDWITFLSSEKNSDINTIFNLAALVLAIFALLFTSVNSSLHTNWLNAAVGFVVLLLVGGYGVRMFLKFGLPLQNHAREAGELLDSIMSGKLKDLSEIEKQWRKQLAKKKAKKK